MAASTITIASTTITSSLLRPSLSTPLLLHQNPTSTLSLPKQNPIRFLKIKTSSTNTHFSHSHQFRAFHSWGNPQVEEDDEGEGEGEGEYEEEEEEGVPSAATPAEESRLYVGNLPYAMTSSELTQLFAEAGQVASVEIVYDRVTNRSRGFAFVTMGSVDDAKQAIQMYDGSQAGGRTVKVNFPEVPRGREREIMIPKMRSSYKGFIDSPYKIYAGNLAWVVTSQGLKDTFAAQPGVLSAKVLYDRDSGRSRGFGFISFESAEEAESALSAMNGVELEGRPLRLNMAIERTATSTDPTEIKSEQETDTEGHAVQTAIGLF